MLASVPFIIATFIVYVRLPELHNLNGNCFLCYLVCLVTLFVPLACVQLNGDNYVDPPICKSVASLIYFSFLSLALWLNVISFDIWLSFRLDFYKFLFKYFRLFSLVLFLMRLFDCVIEQQSELDHFQIKNNSSCTRCMPSAYQQCSRVLVSFWIQSAQFQTIYGQALELKHAFSRVKLIEVIRICRYSIVFRMKYFH